MPSRERGRTKAVGWVTKVGIALPAAFVVSIGLSDISGYLARLDLLDWILNCAMLLSVPWVAIATLLVIVRWRDLPQRFWITYCINAFLAYASLPIYFYHFAIFL